MLVCLAVWGSGRIADGAGKILFITLCIATFVITGFEHSVANMTLFSIGLMAKSTVPLAFSGVVHNLIERTGRGICRRRFKRKSRIRHI